MNKTGFHIQVAESADDLARCWPVMRELRPHIKDETEFNERVRRQRAAGYLVAFLSNESIVRAVAGYRFIDMLFSGHHLYVDDLVTREADRSDGYGGALFDWLVEQARQHGCATLELDSGVQRFDAHRFYFMKRMKIASYHFSMALTSPPQT